VAHSRLRHMGTEACALPLRCVRNLREIILCETLMEVYPNLGLWLVGWVRIFLLQVRPISLDLVVATEFVA
jgi:hypothetical protein